MFFNDIEVINMWHDVHGFVCTVHLQKSQGENHIVQIDLIPDTLVVVKYTYLSDYKTLTPVTHMSVT